MRGRTPDRARTDRRRGPAQGLPPPGPARSTTAPSSTSTRRHRPPAAPGVLAAMEQYYETTHANVHRGVYATAEEATRLYEGARTDMRPVHRRPRSRSRGVFTKNTTEALNLVAHAWGRTRPDAGDVVVLTEMEHHANIVPWLMLAEERGVRVPLPAGRRERAGSTSRTSTAPCGVKLVGISAMSNVLGTINPLARSPGRPTLLGRWWWPTGPSRCPTCRSTWSRAASTSWPSRPTRCSARPGSGCSGHGPSCSTRCRRSSAGGGMILDVRLDRFLPADPPQRFEAGTPPIAEAVGLSAAVDYLGRSAWSGCATTSATSRPTPSGLWPTSSGTSCRVFGPPAGDDRGGVLSWRPRRPPPRRGPGARPVRGVRAAGSPLRQAAHAPTGRAGHRPGVDRPYNDEHDIDVLIEGLVEAGRLFG